jgi:hypothetical protein
MERMMLPIRANPKHILCTVASITEPFIVKAMDTTALEVKRVQHSEDLLHPGEYVFVPKREPIVTIEKLPTQPPQGKFKLPCWTSFRKKEESKQIVETAVARTGCNHPELPYLQGRMRHGENHKIISVEPHAFEIFLRYSDPKSDLSTTLAEVVPFSELAPSTN